MKIQSFLNRCLLLAALLTGFGSLHAAESRPNIVFILVDDLRWDSFSCTGHPFVKTPNIDRIANEGALFKNYFVTIPLCSPSRASYLTGQYAHTHGVKDNTSHNELSHKLVTFPKLLHDAGYETAYVGKWHMGNDASPRPGFDRWVSFKGQGVYMNPPMNIDGKDIKAEGYMTDLLTGHAVDFVQKQHSKPWALYLAHKAVHGPFTPAERHANLYVNAVADRPPNVVKAAESRAGKPALTASGKGEAKATRQNKKKKDAPAAGDGEGSAPASGTMLNQLRCLASIDDGVGQLLKALEATKQLDNTMFVFTSDNGYFWGEHGLGDKRWAYEESIRDPLFVRYPKLIRPGTKYEQLVLNIDIAPTFLELAGVKVPATMQGRSLLPFFTSPTKNGRSSFLTEYHRDGGFTQPPWQTVRTDRWKYIHYLENADWDELYDLQNDRYEMKNLIKEPAAQAELLKLKAELQRLLKETGAN